MKLTTVASTRRESLLGDLAPLLEKDLGSKNLCFTKTGQVIYFRFYEEGYEVWWDQVALRVTSPDGEVIDCGYNDGKLFGQDMITCERKDTNDLVWVAEVHTEPEIAFKALGCSVNAIQESALATLAKKQAITLFTTKEDEDDELGL